MTKQRYQFQRQAYQNAKFSSVAEAYRPDPPSPAGVNFYHSYRCLSTQRRPHARPRAMPRALFSFTNNNLFYYKQYYCQRVQCILLSEQSILLENNTILLPEQSILLENNTILPILQSYVDRSAQRTTISIV